MESTGGVYIYTSPGHIKAPHSAVRAKASLLAADKFCTAGYVAQPATDVSSLRSFAGGYLRLNTSRLG